MIVAACIVAVYHLCFTAWGLTSGFTFDDLMNLGRSLEYSKTSILRDIVLFFRPSHLYRPWGDLWYRLIYESFGFVPLPYRISIHLLMACNVVLAYRVFLLIGGVRSVALMAALIMSYHPELQVFLYNTGFCYDLWCFFFYFLALLVYLKRRQRHPTLRRRDLAGVLILLVLALDSKEAAVTLPVILLAFELAKGGRWTLRRAVPLLATIAVTAAFLVGRMYGAEGLGSLGGAYRPEFTLSHAMTQGSSLVRQFFLLDKGLAVLALIVVASALRKDRTPMLGLTLAVVGVLPIIFLERGLATAYIGMAGLALSVSWLIHTLSALLIGDSAVASVVSFCVLFSFVVQRGVQEYLPDTARHGQHRFINGVIADVRALNLSPAPGARILMLSDPFSPRRYTSTFLMMILFHDPEIAVDWPSEGPQASSYYAVLTMENGHVRRAAIRP